MQRFFLVWLLCIVWHLALYYGSQYLEGEPHRVGWTLDWRIPVVPGFIYFYCSWFFLLLLVPLELYCCAPEVCVRYLLAYVIDHAISFTVFLLYPTTFQRPAPAGRGATNFVFRQVYGANHRFLNCVPSVHCSVSILFACAALACPALPTPWRAVFLAFALLIVCSTVLVKQHVLIDVITAVPTALLCWFLAGLADAERLVALLGL